MILRREARARNGEIRERWRFQALAGRAGRRTSAPRCRLDDGRIGLPREPLAADIAADSLSAALQAARESFQELAADAASANVDKRAVALLDRIAARIPQAPPTQDELFRLAHVEDLLDGYAKTVDDEWPPLLASAYHALRLQFERTMRQFPRWREFKRNAEKERLTDEQIAAAAPLVIAFSKTLQGAEAERFVEPALPKALSDLAAPVGATQSDSDGREFPIDIIVAGKERLAEDVLESTNNVLKKISEATLAAWRTTTAGLAPFGRGINKHLKGLGSGFEKAAEKAGPRDGAMLFKWGRRILLGLGGYGITWGTGLLDKLPSSFGWLEDFIPFLQALGKGPPPPLRLLPLEGGGRAATGLARRRPTPAHPPATGQVRWRTEVGVTGTSGPL